MTDEPLRPDPDRLLEQTAAPHRGKLKIFFGACAGVGKTFAMLAEAWSSICAICFSILRITRPASAWPIA
jgi:hypothetical protein